MCEVFNRQLVDGRDKPIITCLKYVRTYLMKRISSVQKVIDKSEGSLTPNATKLLESIKSEAAKYNVEWNGGNKYQVTGPWMDQYDVDINEKECTCRRWELIGLPYKHVVANIWNMALNGAEVGLPKSWVCQCYHLTTWKNVYKFKVDPINGSQLWPNSTCPTTLTPPKHHTQVGRSKKRKRKSAEETTQSMVRGRKLSRSGKTVTCTKCHNMGHNSRSCKGQQMDAGCSQNTNASETTVKAKTCSMHGTKSYNARRCTQFG